MSRTSTAVKRRYNNKVYTKITADIPKDLGNSFREYCQLKSMSQRQALILAVTEFLKKYDEYPEDPEDE